jgi:hypothetical protein
MVGNLSPLRVFVFVVLLLGLVVPGAEAETRGAVALGRDDHTEEYFSGSHALVIGIDRYTGGWQPLRNAVADARAVAEALDEWGFDSVRLAIDPSRIALEAALEDFVYGPAADPDARVLIWFAGHGHTIDGVGYLVPPEAPLPGVGPGADADFRRVALSMRRFDAEYLREIRARHVLAVFDACFAGTIFTATRSVVAPPSVRFAAQNPVVTLITAGQAGEEVRDDGLFRQLFIDALSGADRRALTDDGYLLGSRLGAFLSEKVADYSEGFQHPAYGKLNARGLDRGDFLFPVRHPLDGVPPAPPASAPTEPPLRSAEPEGAEAWSAILLAPTALQSDQSAVSAPLARLRVGTRLTVTGPAEGSWLPVRLPDGRAGWVRRSDNLRPLNN